MILKLFTAGLSENEFELLCKDGSRRPVNEYAQCNWGKVQSDALVVSSAKSSSVRRRYQEFIQVLINTFHNEALRTIFTTEMCKLRFSDGCEIVFVSQRFYIEFEPHK